MFRLQAVRREGCLKAELQTNPFAAARRAALREEILRDGLLADRFLSDDPDVATFGLNLACVWPFPETWRMGYETLAARLRALGPEVYVYPFAFTHVTLVTLASFSRHVRPAAEAVKKLAATIPELKAMLAPMLAENSPERLQPFVLQPQTPVLTRGAAILPLLNPDGEVPRLRQRVVEMLRRRPALHDELNQRGFNTPGIIHSTVLRFRQPPGDPGKFLAAFDAAASEVSFPSLTIREVMLTSETKPYMRGGEVLQRFPLGT